MIGVSTRAKPEWLIEIEAIAVNTEQVVEAESGERRNAFGAVDECVPRNGGPRSRSLRITLI